MPNERAERGVAVEDGCAASAAGNQPRPVFDQDEDQRNDVHGGQDKDDGPATEEDDAELPRMDHDEVPVDRDDCHVDEVFEDYQNQTSRLTVFRNVRKKCKYGRGFLTVL